MKFLIRILKQLKPKASQSLKSRLNEGCFVWLEYEKKRGFPVLDSTLTNIVTYAESSEVTRLDEVYASTILSHGRCMVVCHSQKAKGVASSKSIHRLTHNIPLDLSGELI